MDKYDVKRVLDSIETMSNDSEALSKKLRSSWMNSGTILKLAEGDEDDRRRGSELLDALVRHIYEIVIDSYNSQYRICRSCCHTYIYPFHCTWFTVRQYFEG